MMRSVVNAIASVNYAMRFQESATALIAPSGQCQAFLPYGRRACWCADQARRGDGPPAAAMRPSAIENPERRDADVRGATGSRAAWNTAVPMREQARWQSMPSS